MIKKGLLLGFLFLAGTVFGQTVKIPISTDIQTRNGKQYYVHTVQKGQTLYSIAKAYHVGLDEIYYANPETRQGIRTGQKIWIPTVNKETEITHEVKTSRFDFFYHVAAARETIDHIASIYLIPKRYILLANPGIKSPLKEGEYVKIPVESAFPILDGKVSGATAQKKYTGGLPPAQSFTPPPTTTVTVPHKSKTSTPATTKVYKKTQPAASAPVPGAFNPDIPVIKDYRHVVVAGQTLESIAKKYDITVNQLKAVNPGLISAFQGERLRLPVNAKVPGYHPSKEELEKALKLEGVNPNARKNTSGNRVSSTENSKPQASVSTSFIRHIVKKKETLYSISRQYGVKLSDLYAANPGLTPNIKVGQVIRIPKKKINTDFVYYQAGQKISLKKVAKLYLTDIHLLVDANPSIGRKVFPGQVVRIPVGEKALLLAGETKKEEERQAAEKTPEEKTTTEISATGRCQPRPHNRIFKVALMVPLYLEETDSINMTDFMLKREKNFAPFRFVNFLEGALIASDSLKNEGMNLQFYVYDVDQRLTKTAKVLTRPELKEMNLIIGPFYSRSFEQVALFADHFNIPIVNPLTFRTEILTRHNNVIKVTPDTHRELSQVTRLVENEYRYDKVFVISQTAYKDAEEVSTLCDSIRTVLPDSVDFPNLDLINIGIAVTQRNKNEEREALLKENPEAADSLPVTTITFNDTLVNYPLENQTVYPDTLKTREYDTTAFPNPLIYIDYSRDSLHPFEQNASVLRNNLVILYGNKKSFIMDAMNRLNVLCDTFNIRLTGLPRWETLSGLNLHQENNMQTTYPASYFVDFNSEPYHRFNSEFYRRFATAPGKYGILGFDITYYFLRALYMYGKKFTGCLPENQGKALSTTYRFKPVNTGENNFENTYWNWLRITRFQLIRLPDSLTETVLPQEK
jgi:LysM repeat protein